MTCTIEECTNKLHTRGVCQRHYKELLGTPQLPRLTSKSRNTNPCVIDGCDRVFYARGYCHLHYNRKKTTGSLDLKPKAPPAHGTCSRYDRGCRCEDCKAAKREYREEWAKRHLETAECGSASKYNAGCRCDDCREAYYRSYYDNSPHGTYGKYIGGCRCDDCKQAYSMHRAEYYANNPEYRQKQIERTRRAREAKR